MQNKTKFSISTIFFFSALFFAFFSFWGMYSYKIYDTFWFVMFFIYEALFFLGLKSGKLMFYKGPFKQRRKNYSISATGNFILFTICIFSILSFLYFIYSYNKIVGSFVFGKYTHDLYYPNMPILEKYTLVLMDIGGPSAFLVISTDRTQNHKKLKVFSSFTLFLIGLRYMLMGSRYVIAVAFLLFLATKWSDISRKIKNSAQSKRQKRLIVLAAVIMGALFFYIFKTRASFASYTSFERMAFNPGDMSVKPFWEMVFEKTNGLIDPFFAISDYLGEAPYVFSYYCKNYMPDEILWGQLICRPISQMLNALLGIGRGYGVIQAGIANGQGQYSGFAFTMIADFGIKLSPLMAYFFGFLFSKIEYYSDRNKYCMVIYPAIRVICFFAPVFYFFVGRIDYAILFALILSRICLRKTSLVLNE